MLSAWAHLLPQLDHQILFQQIDMDPLENGLTAYSTPPTLTRPRNVRLLQSALSVVVCPSDRVRPGNCSFRVCWGTRPGSETGRAPPGDGGFPGAWYQSQSPEVIGPARLSLITDGLSQTVMISERVVGDYDPSHFTPSRDTYFFDGPVEPPFLETPVQYAQACEQSYATPLPGEMSFGGASWLLAGKAFTIYNHLLGPNSPVPDCSATGPWMYGSATSARSWHPGGVNVAFADGAVRIMSESIDLPLWRTLGTRNGSELTGE